MRQVVVGVVGVLDIDEGDRIDECDRVDDRVRPDPNAVRPDPIVVRPDPIDVCPGVHGVNVATPFNDEVNTVLRCL